VKNPKELWKEVQSLKSELEVAEGELLRSVGWTLTCEMGSYWFWKREVKGKTIFLSKESALQYTRSNDDVWEEEEEEK
jgi:sugar lactone lactonase YvrE